MYRLFIKSLVEWNETSSERTKLQYAYVAMSVLLIFTAGIIGLLNYDLGQKMTGFALAMLVMFIVNLVVWTLLQGIVLARLDAMKKPTRKSTKK